VVAPVVVVDRDEKHVVVAPGQHDVVFDGLDAPQERPLDGLGRAVGLRGQDLGRAERMGRLAFATAWWLAAR
jgi:hypothetical protein